MLASFFKGNKAAYKAFTKAKKLKESGKAAADSDSEDSEEETKPKKKEKAKKASAVSAGTKRKRTESVASENGSTSAAKKRKRAESINSVKSEVSDDKPPKRKASMDAAEKIAQDAGASGKPKDYHFKRIDTSKFSNNIAAHFQDNSFEAKARFGKGGDSYGSWSNSKLHDKKGASFIKEKNKMKNRQSHASGSFNAMAVNSIKF